jgi:hypothetical protein
LPLSPRHLHYHLHHRSAQDPNPSFLPHRPSQRPSPLGSAAAPPPHPSPSPRLFYLHPLPFPSSQQQAQIHPFLLLTPLPPPIELLLRLCLLGVVAASTPAGEPRRRPYLTTRACPAPTPTRLASAWKWYFKNSN